MRKILYTTNWDWVFKNFRAPLARAASEAGYEVGLVCPAGKHIEDLRQSGIRWIEWSLDRRSLRPHREASAIWRLAEIYAEESPDLVHHDTIKPNVYGGLATRLNRYRRGKGVAPSVISSFMGTGFLFSDRIPARALRSLVLPFMHLAINREDVFLTFSNAEDRVEFLSRGLATEDRSCVIVSEFVKVERFGGGGAGTGHRPTRVLMAARLLWDKGVETYVEASRILQARGVEVEFLLAGEPDPGAPGSVPRERLMEWDRTGLVRWLGYRSDMPDLLGAVDIAVLPSHYNEGMPRFLVEGAASGLPLIATDLAACRRVVNHDLNGLVIPLRDPKALADAVYRLHTNRELRRRMGNESRRIVEQRFSQAEVVEEWLRLYARLLDERPST